jgi:D-2-hydroxyacid dehydrogenase (NADP+)
MALRTATGTLGAACRKLGAKQVPDPVQIKSIIVDVPLPKSVSKGLQEGFPGIDFTFADDDERNSKLATADAYVNWSISPETLAAAANLKWFQSVAAGVENVLTPDLIRRDLIVTNTSGVHASNIAEHVLAMMLAFARRFPFLFRAQTERKWKEEEAHNRMNEIFELGDQTLLVVGYGDIGQRLARICSALGMTVDAVKRTSNGETDAYAREITPISELPRLLATADHVAICLPLTSETRNLFNAERFAEMKPGSFLYNIGRGQIVDTDALVAALASGHLRGAGLDVTDPEPLPKDHSLWDMENVIITAHTAGATPHYWERAAKIIATNIERFSSDQSPVNLVDQRLGY